MHPILVMTQNKKTSLRFAGLLAAGFILALSSSPGVADDYAEARGELVAAYQAEDFPTMVIAAENALAARPGYASALFNLAFAQVLNGDPDASFTTMQVLLRQKVDFGIADIEAFAALKELPGWPDYAAAISELDAPLGSARLAYSYESSDFIPEGIAVDDDGSLYLGSIRHGDIVRVDGDSTTIVSSADGPHWSVFGMRIHAGKLWFVSSAIEEFAGLKAGDAGKNGVFAVDLASNEIVVRVALPESENKQVLGDLIVETENTLLLADQADGVIWRYSIDDGSFARVIERGVIGSPQGLVLSVGGEYLFVADYIGGIYRVHLATGEADLVESPEDLSLYGIDGLYRHGERLIAVQNGVRPNRVLDLQLNDDGSRVESSHILAMSLPEFDEPNLGQVVGDRFLFIANSHWTQFDRDRNLPEGLSGPIVLEVDLQAKPLTAQ